MRVIAGSARRLLLVTPPGLDTRPTQDKIKETLFNILQMQVPGSVFLDICAGSGGIGIEAISRGARRAYFIENGRAAISCIQQNLHKTGFEDQAVILRQSDTDPRAVRVHLAQVLVEQVPVTCAVTRATLNQILPARRSSLQRNLGCHTSQN